jgi:hypothetical protein
MPIYEQREQSRSGLRKSQSRERYFQSQISTLPGPSTGLNCVKTREQQQRQEYDQEQSVKKKGL